MGLGGMEGLFCLFLSSLTSVLLIPGYLCCLDHHDALVPVLISKALAWPFFLFEHLSTRNEKDVKPKLWSGKVSVSFRDIFTAVILTL